MLHRWLLCIHFLFTDVNFDYLLLPSSKGTWSRNIEGEMLPTDHGMGQFVAIWRRYDLIHAPCCL